MPPQKLFRRPPPKEFVNEILHACGLRGLHDLRWFSRDELDLSGSEQWLPLLEPYYLPCKATRFLYDFCTAKLITVIRHIAMVHGYQLNHVERLYKERKQTLYQLVPVAAFRDISGETIHISFD